ncbi:hypothetical protein, partial [Nitrosomonas sp.]|uniref:hypothetical protein n=1 Tax=Nitrosomonas sp. TaxID=42353 RepID=UPI0028460306
MNGQKNTTDIACCLLALMIGCISPSLVAESDVIKPRVKPAIILNEASPDAAASPENPDDKSITIEA